MADENPLEIQQDIESWIETQSAGIGSDGKREIKD